MTRFTFPRLVHQHLRRRAAKRRLADRRGRPGRPAGSAPQVSRLSLLLLSLPGLAAVAALLFTWLQVGQADRQLRITEDQQITSRFNDAVGNLASKSVDVRLGGIYALERIMKNSAADQPTVVSLLCAYVRQHAPLPRKAAPSADVFAAMDVLARRQPEHDQGVVLDLSDTDLRNWRAGQLVLSSEVWLQGVLLNGADLRGAELSGADLSGAFLNEANLADADLEQANLAGAVLCFIKCANLRDTLLRGANLQGADLSGADLTTVSWCDPLPSEGGCANLREAELSGAKLTDANLRNVDLSYANLTDADLDGADLTGAKVKGTVLEGVKIPGVKGLSMAPSSPPSDRGGRMWVAP